MASICSEQKNVNASNAENAASVETTIAEELSDRMDMSQRREKLKLIVIDKLNLLQKLRKCHQLEDTVWT